MDFYSAFKSFLGIPNSVPPRDFIFEEFYPENYEKGLELPDEDEDEPTWQEIIGNGFEMQKMMEEHMNHMMRAFGLGNGGSLFGDFFNTQPPRDHLELDPPNNHKSLREQYLKPGFDHPSTSKADSDVDGKLDINELDTVLAAEEETQLPITPYKRPDIRKPPSSFFGQTMSTRTIVKPDGTMETTKTVNDNEGNRETTVTHRNKDSEYTIITRVDKDGFETKEEKYVNLSGNPESVIPYIQPSRPNMPRSFLDLFWKK